MKTILDEMNIDDEVRDALLYDKGLLGEIYALVRDIEQFNTKKVSAFEKKYQLPEASFRDLMLDSMREVTIFENSIK